MPYVTLPWNNILPAESQKNVSETEFLDRSKTRPQIGIGKVTKNPRTLACVISALFFAATVTGCDLLGLSGPSGPGELHAIVVSQNALEGASVLELSGPTGLGAILSDDGEVFYERDGTTTRVVVILDDPGQITFYMRVEDVSELPSLTVVQVADGNNELRSSIAGYDVEWNQLADSDRQMHRSAQ